MGPNTKSTHASESKIEHTDTKLYDFDFIN